MLGCADQPADSINHLALRVQLLLLGLLTEKYHCIGPQREKWVIKTHFLTPFGLYMALLHDKSFFPGTPLLYMSNLYFGGAKGMI